MTYTPARPPGINATWPIVGLIFMTGLTVAAGLNLIHGLEGPRRSCIIDTDFLERASVTPEADRQKRRAEYLEFRNEFAEAEPLRESVLIQYEQAYGRGSTPTVRAEYARGNNLYMQGKYELAWSHLNSACYWLERMSDQRDEDLLARTYGDLATIQMDFGNLAQAELMAQRSLKLSVKHQQHHCLFLARAQNTMANVYLAQGQYKKAAAMFDKCLPRMVELDDDIVSSVFCNAADCQTNLKNYARANALLNEAHSKHNPNCSDFALHEQWIQEHRDFLKLKMRADSPHSSPRKRGTA